MSNILVTMTKYATLKNKLEQEEKELEILKNEIVKFMDGKDELIVGQYKATNKECTRNGIDEKQLKEKYPSIAEELKKVTTYRRFVCK